MQYTKLFYILSIISITLLSSVGYADTCYDPNYDSYYNCAGDEYIAPVDSSIFFGAVIDNNNNGYMNHGNYNNRNHGGYNGGYHGNGKHH